MDKQYKIPSSIASKLEQIKLYMGTHSVTAFVGAGFSLNAEIPSNVKMKTWNQLRETFLDKLYPNNEEERAKDGNDVVRLASLVDAEFGHNELDNILQDALPDGLISPGKLHRMLVKLPWKDILTTNYDTLIERAASQVVSDFKLVTNKDTLLYRPSPRIIKLHGSFPDIHPYIMTQEDYRRYPMERPEMVNTAKQCFLESLVCLIGFSGEDPNFRAWIGWLKDVIGQARLCPTYLVTYSKGFHDAEKALLAHIGIDIINIAEVGGVEDFCSAFEFFLGYLQEQPVKWKGFVEFKHLLPNETIDNDDFPKFIADKIAEMQSVRTSYPGWLILPKSYEKDFMDTARDIVWVGRLYNSINDETTKLHFLYELNWRLYISATPCNVDWFVNAIANIVEHLDEVDTDNKWMLQSLLLTYLTVLRYKGKYEEFNKLCQQLLNRSNIVPARYIYYQQALCWLNRYDRQNVKQILTKWDAEYSDYPNCLQKANILYFTGNSLEAFQLLTRCKEAIARSLLQNKDNVYAKSCLTYVLKTMSWCNTAKAPVYDQLTKFAIGESFENLTERLCGKAYDKTQNFGFMREHQFGIGNFTNSWSMGSTGFVKDYLYPYRWWMLKERIGVSMFMINENYTTYSIKNMFSYSFEMAWNMMMLSASTKVIENVFGRETLTLISEEQANEYFDAYISLFESKDIAGEDWVNNKTLNILPVVLGRLCVKASQDRALRFIKAALNWKPSFVNKVLANAYDCLDNKNLSVIWMLLLTEKKLDTKYNNDGYSVPNRYMLNFVITDSIKKRIINGLESTDKDIQLQALIMFEAIWHREELSDDDRRNFSNVIRKMRNSDHAILEAIYTYSNVDADESEKTNISEMLDDNVRTFCETSYVITNSSEPFSQWHGVLERFYVLNIFLSEEKKKIILLHNYDLIEQSKAHFEKDDSQDFFGGMRRFTRTIVEKYQRLFLTSNLENWTDAEFQKMSDQIDWLVSKGYHCLPMKVKASMEKYQYPSGTIINQIKVSMFSKDDIIQAEGIRAFFVMADDGIDVDDIVSYIFDNLMLADERAYKELLILFANLVARGYTKNSFIENLLRLLYDIHQNYNQYDMDVVGLADLQHYANYVAGTIYAKNINSKIPFFQKEEVGFNDVVVGFDKGIEFANHKNN